MTNEYRVEQAADDFGYRYVCDQCGDIRPRDNHKATVAALRRHAAANPDHDVWMSHVVMTHFFARKRTTA